MLLRYVQRDWSQQTEPWYTLSYLGTAGFERGMNFLKSCIDCVVATKYENLEESFLRKQQSLFNYKAVLQTNISRILVFWSETSR